MAKQSINVIKILGDIWARAELARVYSSIIYTIHLKEFLL